MKKRENKCARGHSPFKHTHAQQACTHTHAHERTHKHVHTQAQIRRQTDTHTHTQSPIELLTELFRFQLQYVEWWMNGTKFQYVKPTGHTIWSIYASIHAHQHSLNTLSPALPLPCTPGFFRFIKLLSLFCCFQRKRLLFKSDSPIKNLKDAKCWSCHKRKHVVCPLLACCCTGHELLQL